MLCATMLLSMSLQLLMQYKLNVWSRDLFNAIEAKNEVALRAQAVVFVPLAGASLLLAVLSVWSRMTTEREWRRWLSQHLYDRWLQSDHHLELKFMQGEHQTPEHRIAEDARIATDLPIDLVLGLTSSLLTGAVFAGVLWSIGGAIHFDIAGNVFTVPGYLMVAAILYSLLLTVVTLTFGRRLTDVIEHNKAAEAELRAMGTQLRSAGESRSRLRPHSHGRRAISAALDLVIARWRELCWQMMRVTAVSHSNLLVVPSLGLLLCTPKYLTGAITLGAVVQAAAAFASVQAAFGWYAENYGRLAEWAVSAGRVASLLTSLDQVGAGTLPDPAAAAVSAAVRGVAANIGPRSPADDCLRA
jgi:vitamin B12/bleomycin/antimicrobial peptide transport system ATP-binding/permease protein